MNSTMHRRLAVFGVTVLTGTVLAVAGGAPATAAPADSTSAGNTTATAAVALQLRPPRRWVRAGDYDSRRECEWAGRRGERRGLWRDYRCTRDWDRDWDRRGRDWDRRGRDRDDEWVLWVERRWRR